MIIQFVRLCIAKNHCTAVICQRTTIKRKGCSINCNRLRRSGNCSATQCRSRGLGTGLYGDFGSFAPVSCTYLFLPPCLHTMSITSSHYSHCFQVHASCLLHRLTMNSDSRNYGSFEGLQYKLQGLNGMFDIMSSVSPPKTTSSRTILLRLCLSSSPCILPWLLISYWQLFRRTLESRHLQV